MKATFEIMSQLNKDVPIYVRFRVPGGKQLRARTKHYINPKDWSQKKQRPLPRDPHLKNLSSDLDAITLTIIRNIPKNTQQLKQLLNGGAQPGLVSATFSSILTRMIETNHEWSQGTKRNYLVFSRLMDQYGLIDDLSLIDKNVIDDFTSWMLNKMNYSKNYAGRQLTRLKTTCRFARTSGINTHPYCTDFKSFSQPKKERIITTLTEEEVGLIKNKSNLNPRLDNARKWLLIGLNTGLRVNDLLSLTTENFRKVGTIFLVDVMMQKTQKMVTVPVTNPHVEEIIQSSFPNKISDVEFNRLIKRVCMEAHINTPTEGYLFNSKTRRKELGTYPKFKLISSHAMRRTFATLHYGKVSTNLLMEITGHGREEMLLRYINQDRNRDDKAMEFVNQINN